MIGWAGSSKWMHNSYRVSAFPPRFLNMPLLLSVCESATLIAVWFIRPVRVYITHMHLSLWSLTAAFPSCSVKPVDSWSANVAKHPRCERKKVALKLSNLDWRMPCWTISVVTAHSCLWWCSDKLLFYFSRVYKSWDDRNFNAPNVIVVCMSPLLSPCH